MNETIKTAIESAQSELRDWHYDHPVHQQLRTALSILTASADSVQEREAVIEECAKHIEKAAKQFIALANESIDSGHKNEAYGLADAYNMAATEVRRMNPEFIAKEQRNLERIKAWRKTVGTPNFTGIPDLEK